MTQPPACGWVVDGVACAKPQIKGGFSCEFVGACADHHFAYAKHREYQRKGRSATGRAKRPRAERKSFKTGRPFGGGIGADHHWTNEMIEKVWAKYALPTELYNELWSHHRRVGLTQAFED